MADVQAMTEDAAGLLSCFSSAAVVAVATVAAVADLTVSEMATAVPSSGLS